MAPQCAVCQEHESKYKCPICALRYCSLPCYKSHRTQHPEQQHLSTGTTGDKAPSSGVSDQAAHGSAFQSSSSSSSNSQQHFKGLESDIALQTLLSRYPLLRVQLGNVYGLTLDPGPNDVHDDADDTAPNDETKDENIYISGGRRGGFRRGGRGGRGGRGWRGLDPEGRGGHRYSNRGDMGSRRGRAGRNNNWTREKGEREALGLLKRMMRMRGGETSGGSTNENSEKMEELGEGMREFVILCGMKAGRK